MKEELKKYMNEKYNIQLTEEDFINLNKIFFSIEKHNVCDSCNSIGIRDVNCNCVDSNNYSTVDLEFKHCNVCKQTIDEPIDSEFNNNYFK
jgi:hypothetical protein